MDENKKEYVQPVVEIEYFDDVSLCDNTSVRNSNGYIVPGEDGGAENPFG